MTRFKLPLIFLFLFFLVSCNSDQGKTRYNDSPEKQKMLQQQRDLYQSNLARWKTVGIMNYEFTRSIDCDCEDKRDIVVNVVNGRVDNAYLVNGKGNVNEGVGGKKLKEYVSIEDFFSMINNAIDHHYDDVDVKYDKDYGYPAKINLVPSTQSDLNNTGKEIKIGFNISNFNIRYTISFPPVETKTKKAQ